MGPAKTFETKRKTRPVGLAQKLGATFLLMEWKKVKDQTKIRQQVTMWFLVVKTLLGLEIEMTRVGRYMYSLRRGWKLDSKQMSII